MSPPPPLFAPGLQPGRSYSEAAGGRHGSGGRKWRNAGLCFLRLTSPFLPVATERGAEQTAVRAAACESLGFVGPIGLVGTRPVNVSHDKREDRQVTGAEAAGHRGAEGGWGRVPELLPPAQTFVADGQAPSPFIGVGGALLSCSRGWRWGEGGGARWEGTGERTVRTRRHRHWEVDRGLASEPETVSATRAASASLTTFTPETITRGGQRGKGREGRGRLRDSVLALRSVLAQEVLAPVARGGVPT